MAVCKYCGGEISDTAKVCRHCGKRVADIGLKSNGPVSKGPNQRTCPSCGNFVSSADSTCRICGAKLSSTDWEQLVNVRNETVFREDQQIGINMGTQFEFINDCVTWRLFPGQIAVKFNGNDLDHFVSAKGIVVQAGTIAMFFDQGEYIGILPPGKHLFKKDAVGSTRTVKPSKPGSSILGFLSSIKKEVTGKISGFFKKKKTTSNNNNSTSKKRTFEVSVVLVRDSEFPLLFDFPNMSTKSIRSNVGLHLMAEISDVESFYINQLMDKSFVAFDSFSKSIEPFVKAVLAKSLSSYSPTEIAENYSVLDEIFVDLNLEIEKYCDYLTITKLVSITADNEEIEKIRRMREELYIAEETLEQTKERYDFLNKAKQAEYQNELDMARTDVDFEALRDKIDEDHLITADKKEEFLMLLKAEKVMREAKSQDNVDEVLNKYAANGLIREDRIAQLKQMIGHQSSMAEERNRQELAGLRNVGEEEDLRAKLNRQRMQAAYEDERRKTEFDFEKQERLFQFELMSKMQEQKDAESDRKMREKHQDHMHEEAMRRIGSEMTPEQILAMSGTPEAAAAMAEKFKADRENSNKDEMKETILSQQAMNMQLMQQMMQAMQGMSADKIRSKDAEIENVRKEAAKSQENFVDGVNNAVKSVAGSYKVTNDTSSPKMTACPYCGAPVPEGFKFCGSCGAKLK